MDINQKLLSIIIIVTPYFMVQHKFMTELELLISKISNDTLGNISSTMILIIYINIFYLSVYFYFSEIINFSQILLGILLIFNSILFYQPFTIERIGFVEHLPSIEIICIFLVGLLTLINGIYSLYIRKKGIIEIGESKIELIDIKDDDEPNNENLVGKNILFELNDIGIKNLAIYALKNYIKYLTYDNAEIYNLNSDNFDFNIKEDCVELNIHNLSLGYKNLFYHILDNVNIKDLKAEINFLGKEIKIKIVQKGIITYSGSCFKSSLLKIGYNLLSGKGEEQFNQILKDALKKEILYKYDIFDFRAKLNEFYVKNSKVVVSVDIYSKINNP